MHVRTVLPILVWVAVALLILNIYLRSEWIFLMSIALIVAAVVIYFIPVIRVRAHKIVKQKSVYGHDKKLLCALSGPGRIRTCDLRRVRATS